MSKIQFCLDTFYIEFHTDKFANISKRYVSFAEKYDQDANIMMLKSRMLNKKNLSSRKKKQIIKTIVYKPLFNVERKLQQVKYLCTKNLA